MPWKINIDLPEETAKRLQSHIRGQVPFDRRERIKSPVDAVKEFLEHLDEREEEQDLRGQLDELSIADMKKALAAVKSQS